MTGTGPPERRELVRGAAAAARAWLGRALRRRDRATSRREAPLAPPGRRVRSSGGPSDAQPATVHGSRRRSERPARGRGARARPSRVLRCASRASRRRSAGASPLWAGLGGPWGTREQLGRPAAAHGAARLARAARTGRDARVAAAKLLARLGRRRGRGLPGGRAGGRRLPRPRQTDQRCPSGNRGELLGGRRSAVTASLSGKERCWSVVPVGREGSKTESRSENLAIPFRAMDSVGAEMEPGKVSTRAVPMEMCTRARPLWVSTGFFGLRRTAVLTESPLPAPKRPNLLKIPSSSLFPPPGLAPGLPAQM